MAQLWDGGIEVAYAISQDTPSPGSTSNGPILSTLTLVKLHVYKMMIFYS